MSGQTITVTLENEGRSISLGGDLKCLLRDPRVFNSFRRLDRSYRHGSRILNIGDSDTNKMLTSVIDALENRGYAVSIDKHAGKVLENFARRRDEFRNFSEHARNIRNNICDPKEFQEFTTTLSSRMPSRSLYPLQLLSAYHLAFSQNACNFSVPGAGKTSIVYGAFSYLRSLPESSDKHIDAILVVGPLSSFAAWEDEYFECFGEYPESIRLDGNMSAIQKKSFLYSQIFKDLTLVTYQSLTSLTDEVKHFLSVRRVMVVMDEAHRMKNVDEGLWATSCLAIAPYASSRVVLTGTPAPNGYEDLYNLFKFIWPDKDVEPFYVNQLREMTADEHDARIPKLLDAIEPYYLRIRKSDLKLPPAEDLPLRRIALSSCHRRIYDLLEQYYLDPYASGQEVRDSRISGYGGDVRFGIVRLMQAATNPAALMEAAQDDNQNGIPKQLRELISDFVASGEVPAKFIEAASLITDLLEEGEKVLVWACYISTINSFHRYLESLGIKSKILYGKTPSDEHDMAEEQGRFDGLDWELLESRDQIVRAFNNPDSEVRVVIANPAAVSESYSMHKGCHNAIYLERDFSAAKYLQSKDRIHRYGLGQDVKTRYYKLAAERTIDEVIDERLEMKAERLLRIVESKEIPLFDNVEEELGDEDIKAIMRSYAYRNSRV